jgi:hypothetical protein
VNHSILARENLYECAERHDSNDSAGVFVTDFYFLGKSLNSVFCLLGGFLVG